MTHGCQTQFNTCCWGNLKYLLKSLEVLLWGLDGDGSRTVNVPLSCDTFFDAHIKMKQRVHLKYCWDIPIQKWRLKTSIYYTDRRIMVIKVTICFLIDRKSSCTFRFNRTKDINKALFSTKIFYQYNLLYLLVGSFAYKKDSALSLFVFGLIKFFILLPKPMKHLSFIRAGVGPLSFRTVKVRALRLIRNVNQ